MIFTRFKQFAATAFLAAAITLIFGGALSVNAQRNNRPRPPRVAGSTVVGTVDGRPVTANDLILTVNPDSPFMPPLDGSPVPVLQQQEQRYPDATQPGTQPVPAPTVAPRPTAPSFSLQIQNLMKTAEDWLFRSILTILLKPLLPTLTFFAWIIASFVLIIAFIRKANEEKGLTPIDLVKWGTRCIVFMVVIGSSPFIIDGLLVFGKFFARPIKSFNHEMKREFDDKMKKYAKANFAVEDPNELIAKRLPNGEPGLIGIVSDKESSVKDITSELNVLGWNMPRMFMLMVVAQNIIKFGGLFLAIAGLFIIIGLKLAAPVLSAFGFDEKFAAQMFYPFCWGVATFALAYPIVKEVTLYIAYGFGLIGLSIYNNEVIFTLDPQTAQIITSGNYDPGSSAMLVTLLFGVSSLCFILVPWLSYRILRGQVYEGVSQVSMGWMLSAVGTALETYGMVAGAAINKQAENTQIQSAYSAESVNAKKSLEAANLSTEARRISSVAGIEGGLVTSLGQIRANQVTQTLLAEANKNFGLTSSQAATRREIAGITAEAEGANRGRLLDAVKESSLRSQGNNQNLGMLKYDLIPGGSSVMGTSLPIKKGVEGYDALNDQHISQLATRGMNTTTYETAKIQNENTTQITNEKTAASNNYQTEMNSAIGAQASATVGAVNAGTDIAAASTRQGANIQLAGVTKSTALENQANKAVFDGRIEAASIVQKGAEEAAHLRMVSTVVSGFFKDMDRRLEEMKPKY